MEYQKIINLDDTVSHPSKFRIRNWVEINYESRGAYKNDNSNNNYNNNNNNNDNNNNIKFKTSMMRSSLCDYSDAYILVKGTTIVPNTAAQDAAVNKTNKKVIFKNCTPFTSCITEINDTQVDCNKWYWYSNFYV